MPAASAAGTRPRSHRGGSSRANLAYDLGHRGEEAPSWLGDDPRYEREYNRGVDDRDAAAAGAPPRRQRTPDPTDADTHAREATPVTDEDRRDFGGTSDAPAREPRRLLPSFSFSSSSGDVTAQLTSAVGGLVAYAVFINFARGGWSRVGQWFFAKLTNNHGSLP